MSRPQLRYANVGDATSILQLWARAAADAHRPPDTVEAIETLIHRDSAALILAVDGEQILGTVIAGWDGWRCHLYRLAVDPQHRRRGIASLLVTAAELRLRQLGGSRVDAMVLQDNADAHELWAARGYHRQQEWARWVRPLDA